MWKEVKVNNWKHFNEIIENFDNNKWIFRGQSSDKWVLESSLYRECKRFKSDIDNISCVNIEQKILKEFKSSYKLYSKHQISEVINSQLVDDWLEERLTTLSIMQHYGTPTRFLDWTYSPFIAGFFALDGSNDNFCIYALNLNHINSYNLNHLKIDSSQKNKIFYSTNQSIKPFLYPYDPIEKNQRLRVQQGLFLVPSLINVPFDDVLKEYGIKKGLLNGEETAIKLIFDKEHLKDWWLRLIQMNITHETIYPGLEGFCKSLKLNLFK